MHEVNERITNNFVEFKKTVIGCNTVKSFKNNIKQEVDLARISLYGCKIKRQSFILYMKTSLNTASLSVNFQN